MNIEHLVTRINSYLKEAIPKDSPYFAKLYESMNYSLEAGGKRIRPLLMLLVYEALGGKEDISRYLCAIEMIHTYSLIHDDLPAMDNDDLRRGRPTNHKVFGEAIAILAGDGLQSYAFEYMLEDALKYEDMNRVRAAYVLANASGIFGMIAGQVLDIESENKKIDKDTLDILQLNKTGALICAATKMGAILAGASSKEISRFEAYGKYLGKAFQIIDDLLDKNSTVEELGKPINSDIKNHKNTYLCFYSEAECYEIASELTSKAIKALEGINGDILLLKNLAQDLINRRN